MDSKVIKEAIDFAADPNTRAAFVSGLTIALFLGYFAGTISCKFLYGLARLIVSEFRVHFQRKELQRETERKRKEDAAKRRLEAYERRKNEKRPLYGILWDRNGTPYCPVCQRALHPFLRDGDVFKSACYACNKKYYCHTKTLDEEVRRIWGK